MLHFFYFQFKKFVEYSVPQALIQRDSDIFTLAQIIKMLKDVRDKRNDEAKPNELPYRNNQILTRG